jgi:mannose-6-phosphate isomerase-like protein (cupin superfamily)
MNFMSAIVAGFAALAIGSNGSAVTPPVSPPAPSGGAAEVQGMTQGARSSEPAGPSRRASFQTNILQAAHSNGAYRRVLFTGARSQLALMTIPVGGDIGVEVHPNVEQLIFIASGHGKAVVNDIESPIGTGEVVVVTPGTRHDIVNTGAEPLRIYTVYAPPNHIDGRVQPTKSDAETDTADEAFGRSTH